MNIKEQMAELYSRIESVDKMRLSKLLVTPSMISDCAAVCFIKDAEGRMVQISEGYEEMFGVPKEEYAGKFDIEIWGDEIGSRFSDHDRIVRENGESWIGYETWFNKKTQRHEKCLLIKTAQYDQSGHCIGTFGIILKDFLSHVGAK